MRPSKMTLVGVSVAALSGIMGGAVVAKTFQNASDGAQEMRAMGFANILSPALIAKLNLSAHQRSEVRLILRDNRPRFIPLLADAHAAGLALREAAASGAGDATLQPLAAKQAEEDLALLDEAAKTQSEIVAVLTPKQRRQARTAIDDRLALARSYAQDGGGPLAGAMARVGARLDLTDDQKIQARGILSQARAKARQPALQLIDRLKQTEDAIASGRYNAPAVGTATDDARQPLADIVLTAATTRERLLALLTPDQKARLKELHRD